MPCLSACVKSYLGETSFPPFIPMEDFSEDIRHVVADIIGKNLLSQNELKSRIFKCIKQLSENESLHILENFTNADLSGVENRESYLYDCFLDHLKFMPNPEPLIKFLGSNIKDISDKSKIEALLKRTNYTLTLSSGQRKYGGPPPHWEGSPPGSSDPKLCLQVHIGRLGPLVFEDTLVPALEECGRIWQLRIMVDATTGENRGFAFVDFFTKEEAVAFVQKYNNKQLGDGPLILARVTVPNCRLFIGGISANRTKETVEHELSTVFHTAQEIKAFSSSHDSKRNRGFAFVTFGTHNDANLARKRLNAGKVTIFNAVVRDADWADNDNPDCEPELKPRTVHARYSGTDIGEERLKSIFSECGEVIKVDKFFDYAFIEFDSEEAAQGALMTLNDKQIDGITLKVSPARSAREFGRKRSLRRIRQQFYENPPQKMARYPPPPISNPRPFYHESAPYYPPQPYPIPHFEPYRPQPPEPWSDRKPILLEAPLVLDYNQAAFNPAHVAEPSVIRPNIEQPKNINWGHGSAPVPSFDHSQNPPPYSNDVPFHPPPTMQSHHPFHVPISQLNTHSQAVPFPPFYQSDPRFPNPYGGANYW